MITFARYFTGFVLAIALAVFARFYPAVSFLCGWVACGLWSYFTWPRP